MARSKNESAPAYFTTHQVAQALGVSAPTVVNWVNAGLLKATRTPGGHRRLRREDVATFAREYAYPLPEAFLCADLPDASRRERSGALRVLLVDDDVDFALVAEAYLERKARFDVSTAHSGFAAGLAMARERPNVVVLDLLMPGVDGFEVLRRMRADAETRDVPVIACSGYDNPEWEERARREAFFAYVRKPTPLDALAQVILAACGCSDGAWGRSGVSASV